jgi:uncharacterized protein YciI
MFVIHSSYIVDVAKVDPHRKAHAEWVSKYIEDGVFLFAGPNSRKSGGAILTRTIGKEQLLEILSEDSYVKAELVDNQIIDFEPVFAQSDLKHFA